MSTIALVEGSSDVALRLLEGDKRIIEAVRNGELGDLTQGSPENQETFANAIG